MTGTHAKGSERVRSHSLILLLVTVLALQALGGLLMPRLYRDSLWIVTALRSSDITNLAVVIPLLLGLLALVRRGSLRAELAFVGVLFYVWENNLYYLAGCSFNELFLVYAAVSVTSLFALIQTLYGLDRVSVEQQTTERMPRKVISLLTAAMAAILCVLWIGQSASYIVTKKLPQMLIDAGGSTHLVAALDLTMLVPMMLLGAALLWRGHVWGTMISAGALIQGALTTIALTITAPVQAAAGVAGAWMMLPLWIAMGICFVAGTVLLLGNITRA